MGQQRTGTLGTAPFRINNTDTPQPASFPNEHFGGYHTYDFWNDGSEFSVCGIRRHHRAWNMLAYAADKGITYKLIKGYKTLDIMDNANWKVWRIESEEQATNKGGLSLWNLDDRPYKNEDFVVHDSKIWQSTIEDNNFTPGAIDPQIEEPVTAWRESSIDTLAHQRNKDQGGVRAGNVYISFQEIYDLILQRVTKAQLDTNIALGESDELVATQKAVKSYVDNLLNNALKSPKAFNASTATTFPSGVKGDTYRVTLPGEVQGVKLQAGDLFFTDKAVAGAVAADWFVVQSNVDQATTEVLGLLRIATNDETIAEQVNDKAIVPSALGAWWSDVKTRANLVFTQIVSFLGINLGTDATGGATRTIAAKGSENSVSVRIDVKGNGTLGSNALQHTGNDTLLAATIEGNFKDTGINPQLLVLQMNMGGVSFVSKGGNNASALAGRIDKPYLTIQAAVDASNAQTIVVLGGDYYEQVHIPYTVACTRLLLWFGAKIISDQAYTLQVGKSGLVCEGQALYFQDRVPVQDSGLINTHNTGKVVQYGSNPGHIYMNFYNLSFRSEGTGTGACVTSAQTCMTAINCKFYAAKSISSYNMQGRFVNCIFDSLDLICETDFYTNINILFEHCQFNSANGFKGNFSSTTFKDCKIKSTISNGFTFYNQTPKIYFENSSIVAQAACLAGDIPSFEFIGGSMQSLTGMPINGNFFQYYYIPKAEIRGAKLIAEATQAFCINNTHTTNKSINLINVAMNKPHNANVAGVIHNVLIEDSLTAL